MIDVDEYNKWKDDNLNDIKLQELDLARSKDKKNILEENLRNLTKKNKAQKPKIENEIVRFKIKIHDLEKNIYNYDNNIIDYDVPGVLNGEYTVTEINDIIFHQINILEKEIINERDKIDDINAEKKRISTVNKQKIAKHQDMLQTLNSGFMKMEQLQGESEEEYLKRLNDIAAQPYNENLYFNATIDNIEKLKKNFKDVTKDMTVIEGVVNGLSTEDKYLVNKFWGLVKKKILSLYIWI